MTGDRRFMSQTAFTLAGDNGWKISITSLWTKNYCVHYILLFMSSALASDGQRADKEAFVGHIDKSYVRHVHQSRDIQGQRCQT